MGEASNHRLAVHRASGVRVVVEIREDNPAVAAAELEAIRG